MSANVAMAPPAAFKPRPAASSRPSRFSAQGRDSAAGDLIWGVTQLDGDRDGKIAEEDVDILLELVYGLLRDHAPGSWAQLKDRCRNWDGSLSLAQMLDQLMRGPVTGDLRAAQEQLGACQPRAYAGVFGNVREYVRCFRAYDADGNGVICASDLRHGVQAQLGALWSRDQCKEVVRRADRDNDGVVGLAEFECLTLQLKQEQLKGSPRGSPTLSIAAVHSLATASAIPTRSTVAAPMS